MSRLSQFLSTLTEDERRLHEQRFWSFVDRSGGADACWFWRRGMSVCGYGEVRFGGERKLPRRRRGIMIRCNIVAWELTNGQVPDGIFVCHSCDARYAPGDITYRRCCNPAHLWLGTTQENTADCVAKGRNAHGEKFSEMRKRIAVRGDAHWTRLHPERIRAPQGEQHPFAKLTNNDVLVIRERCASGEVQEMIARDFGVSQSVVSNVFHRKRWKHVTG